MIDKTIQSLDGFLNSNKIQLTNDEIFVMIFLAYISENHLEKNPL